MEYNFVLLFSSFGFLRTTYKANIKQSNVDGRKKIILNPKLCGAYPGLIPKSSNLNSLTIKVVTNNPIAKNGNM